MPGFAIFGFVVVYLMPCIVAPMDLHRSREMRVRHLSMVSIEHDMEG